jgi:GntR family transcriptional regulator/MocR family aminotransferase
LPPTRQLAAELGLSRGVVTEAYRRLAEDGHVAGRGRAGTTVVAVPVAAPEPVPAGWARPVKHPFLPPNPGPDIFARLRTVAARIDLSPGLPDLAAFPRAAWLRTERQVLARLAASDFGYGDPSGAPQLRGAVATWLARTRGVRVVPEQVIIVAGAAQAVGLLAQVLHDRGVRRIAVEDPGSLGMRQHLHAARLETPPVTVDAAGISVSELRSTEAPVALVTPAHQFPLGVVLDGERRRELLGWAADGGLLIEDDYDAEHRYDRPPVAALHSLQPDRVCYVGSVSKSLAPALRLGWLIVPRQLHDDVASAKQYADLGNPVLTQLVLAELIASGELERHLRYVRGRHRRRRNAMIAAIAAHLPEAQVYGAAAGLHLTVTLPSDVADADLAQTALTRGVKLHPLSWYSQRTGRPGLVIGYGARTTAEIAEGVAMVGDLLRRPSRPR